MSFTPALFIFDCDGVLVDSELLGNRVLAAVAGECGLALDPHEALTLFKGCKMSDCVATLSERLGHALPDNFVATGGERRPPHAQTAGETEVSKTDNYQILRAPSENRRHHLASAPSDHRLRHRRCYHDGIVAAVRR